MDSLLTKLKLVFIDEELRTRILYMIGGLAVFRLLAAVPIPGINELSIAQFFSNNQFFGFLNIFTGGGLSNLSVVMLGVGPFITASIIMQLMTAVFPRLKELYHDEGEAGRMKFTQYSRLLTVPLAAVQGFGFLTLLTRQGVIAPLAPFDIAVNLVIIVAGAILVMWLGELMTEFGVGNGVSILIFAGIVSALPGAISQLLFTFDASQLPTYIGFILAAILITYGVVIITEAERSIPITHAKQVRGRRVYGATSSYLPLRVNQAGVMPIIFALSIVLLPQLVLNFLTNAHSTLLAGASSTILALYQNLWLYGTIYFLLVFLFTYFYTAITFEPDSVAENLQKSGAFIPGVRPGRPTSEYLGKVMTRITMVGAVFLGLIAILPIVMQAITGMATLAIGGTALLIVVAVVIDLVKRIDAQIAMHEY
jgi:preprotein translocase subunit SecY